MKRVFRIVIALFLGVGLAAAVIAGVLFCANPRIGIYMARPYILWATNRTAGCSLPEIARVVPNDLRIYQIENRLRRDSRVLATDGKLIHWQTPMGLFWAPKFNDPFYLLAEQEVSSYAFGNVRVKPGDVVLDCGANIGDFTALALKAGAQLVVAIEPSPAVVECLRRTFAREPRVVICPKAVWHEETTMKFWSYQANALNSAVMTTRTESIEKPVETTVPATTIDKLVNGLGLSRVDFIKMDIEGAERNAVRGARETIRRFRPRMALASENLSDDYVAVPFEVASAVNGYVVSHTACRILQDRAIRPEILFFNFASESLR